MLSRSVRLMSTNAETGKPMVKSKKQIEAEFKRLHIDGFDQLREIKGIEGINLIKLKGGAAKKDSTDTQASE